MQNFEILGEFYLGNVVDEETMQTIDQHYLLDSKDLTTHAVIVGMTGSGKTGLAIGLLEEAAMDNIPALVIDPKGDMSNLMLSFPEFKGEDFAPWIDAKEAEQSGKPLDEYAEDVADEWREGLARSGITPERLRTYQEQVDISVYTPGSSAGKQLSILDLVDLPSDAILNDSESLNDYLSSTVSSLLSLLGIEADPINSREHILISNILLDKWNKRESTDLATLIHAIQSPGIDKIGIMRLEDFYPQSDRNKLAMQFNNLLASPSFATWLEGDTLSIQDLLYTADGKPRISVISLSHLNEEERLFIVSIILTKVVSWTRSQSGTSSLRALLYMDEIFGYFPPVSNPPTKQPLLTLLKQARAYGLGVVLATQNPVDLDYKGLSNIGAWFIGRLQTEQDKNRLLDGLKSADGAGNLDVKELSDLISAMPKRTFLVNNVHEEGLELFQTRWAMSYLAGPLSRNQIANLDQDKSVAKPASASSVKASLNPTNVVEVSVSDVDAADANKDVTAVNTYVPNVHKDITQAYLLPNENVENIVYQASLYADVDTLFEDKKSNINTREQSSWNTPISTGLLAVDWAQSTGAEITPSSLTTEAETGATFLELPASTSNKTVFNEWRRDLETYIYNEQKLTLYTNPLSELVSQPGEEKREFLLRIEQTLRENRDEDIADLKVDYHKKLNSANEKVRKAEAKVEREEGQQAQSRTSTLINIGTTLLDSFLGTKKFGKSTMNKAGQAARSASRTSQQSGDVARAKEDLQVAIDAVAKLETDLEQDLNALSEKYSQASTEVAEFVVTPLKKNIDIRAYSLVWLPYAQDVNGSLRPVFNQELNVETDV